MQFTGEPQGQTTQGKTWTNHEVPGGLVKMEANGFGRQVMTVKMVLTKTDLIK